MLFNLSLKNIKKSFKDYSIYFFTLVVAIAIFYVFNSIDSQTSMLAVSSVKHNVIENLISLLGYISVFVSIILGFLIIYSNNFLIKRRKKEIGLYLTLGMSKRKVSTILVLETLVIGIFSLGVGLLTGIFLSQFLSIVTANLFEVDMANFKFVFSSAALYKTLIYFGVIFILVMLFNVFTLSKYKLIDLLNASKKNEKVTFRNKWLTLISFVLSVCLMVYAYYLLFNGSLLMMGNDTLIMVICGAVGTYLFFFSLSGFLLTVLQKTKLYYKNLNMFILRQINSKINTSVMSTTIICLMLLLTIGILAGSISLSDSFNKDFNTANITDFTINEYTADCIVNEGHKCTSAYVEPTMNDVVLKNEKFQDLVKEYVYLTIYYDEHLTAKEMLSKKSQDLLIEQYGNALNISFPISIMTVSDYNKLLDLYGNEEEKVVLKENEYILTSNLESISIYLQDNYKTGNKIMVNGKELCAKDNIIKELQIGNYSVANNSATIVISDNLVKDLTIQNVSIIGNYEKTDNIEKTDNEFVSQIELLNNRYNTITKVNMRSNGIGLKVILTFVGLYLGIIFAISSVTVLAIGQLSESSDNKDRYRIIRQLGTDEKMISKALYTQIGIIFILPLVVALFHAFFGLREIINIIQILGSIDLTKSIMYTTIFIVIIYGGYFLATYLCSKAIIKD